MNQTEYNERSFRESFARVKAISKSTLATRKALHDKNSSFPVDGINALKEAKLFGCLIPFAHGGLGYSVSQVSKICEEIAMHCPSTGLIFAMHQIQVITILKHGNSRYFDKVLSEIAKEQLLIASGTSEKATGGDIGSSYCYLSYIGDNVTLSKLSPIVSYAEQSDALLITARQSSTASQGNQSLIFVKSEQVRLEKRNAWNSFGFRATCSHGYSISVRAKVDQILSISFLEALNETMLPISHLFWSAVWAGMASGVVEKTRACIKERFRGGAPFDVIKRSELAEIERLHSLMGNNLKSALFEFENATQSRSCDREYGSTKCFNELKISSSNMLIEITHLALLACGIEAYTNDSKYSLGQELRDAYGAALMVSNSRILASNIELQL